MKFTYHGTPLEGFDAPYNNTILNERAVELAVAFEWLKGRDSAHGLEVGNVLSHYGVTGHRVVDFYEKADGVENVDVFDITGKFKWIVSISTLEHVGWDAEPRDPDAAERAVEHLRSLLAPKGKMLITAPAGYNPSFDKFLKTGAGATRDATMNRDKTDGWKQSKTRTFKPYGSSTPWAETVWIGEYGA